MIKIGNCSIGNQYEPFIVAELSGNHNQSLEKALEIVSAAAEAGAHAIKLQTYTADTITMNQRGGLFEINDPKSLWSGYNLYELYQKAHTPWEWHERIFIHAKSLGMVAFSSPFDETAVDFLEKLDVPAYKIASFESNHHPLLKKVAITGKPVIISSGTSNLVELLEAVDVLKENGCEQIIILKCTSTYPAKIKDSNLNTIPVLQDIFSDCIIGLSDHTMGMGAALGAITLGARIIEKHITLNRKNGAIDSEFSMEPLELKTLVEESKRVFQALGKVQLNVQVSEYKSRQFRRSIYVSKMLQKGSIITKDNIKIIRPGDGLEPKYYERILGLKVNRNLKESEPFKLSYISNNS